MAKPYSINIGNLFLKQLTDLQAGESIMTSILTEMFQIDQIQTDECIKEVLHLLPTLGMQNLEEKKFTRSSSPVNNSSHLIKATEDLINLLCANINYENSPYGISYRVEPKIISDTPPIIQQSPPNQMNNQDIPDDYEAQTIRRITNDIKQASTANKVDLTKMKKDLNNPEVVRELLWQALEKNQGNAETWYCLGINAYMMGNFKEAEKAYNVSIQLNPKFSLAYSDLGALYAAQKRNQEAIMNFNKAIQLDSTNPDFWNKNGQFLFSLGRLAEADELVKKALQFHPTNASLWDVQGSIYHELKKYKKAITAYETALTYDPTELNTGFKLAIIFYLKNKIKKAEPLGQNLIRNYPKLPYGWTILGFVFRHQARWKEAEQALNFALTYASPDFKFREMIIDDLVFVRSMLR